MFYEATRWLHRLNTKLNKRKFSEIPLKTNWVTCQFFVILLFSQHWNVSKCLETSVRIWYLPRKNFSVFHLWFFWFLQNPVSVWKKTCSISWKSIQKDKFFLATDPQENLEIEGGIISTSHLMRTLSLLICSADALHETGYSNDQRLCRIHPKMSWYNYYCWEF